MLVTVEGKCTVVRYCRSRNADSGIEVILVSLISNNSIICKLLDTKFQSLLVNLPVTFKA